MGYVCGNTSSGNKDMGAKDLGWKRDARARWEKGESTIWLEPDIVKMFPWIPMVSTVGAVLQFLRDGPNDKHRERGPLTFRARKYDVLGAPNKWKAA